MRRPGHREGVRRYQRYDQMGLGVVGTLAYDIPIPEDAACGDPATQYPCQREKGHPGRCSHTAHGMVMSWKFTSQ